MRLSRYFLPVLKETPSDAQIPSHQLMLRAGMIRQSSAGIYSWLPLGLKVLRKVEAIVRSEMDAAGAQEVLMPTIQSADIWRESGRYDDYGKEMLRIIDRHEREMLYGPTNEELITQIVRDNIKSYRELGKNLYHIQWKFRDEVRPRFGVMRGREFLMKDAYSFDLDEAGARIAYQKMFLSYLRTFARMGLKAIPMRADTGPIGGDMSHEFIVLAETGESAVFCHKGLLDYDPFEPGVSYNDDLKPVVDKWTGLYAATEEKHNPVTCPVPEADLIAARGIEVGHIFYFGTKYSKAMNAKVTGPDGQLVTLEMGSYGIGVSRLVGAIIEASHDDKGIIWPEPVSPFDLGLINLKNDDVTCNQACDDFYQKLQSAGKDVLYDDTADRPGAKFATMELIGLPQVLVVGPRGLKDGKVELRTRKTGLVAELSIDQAINQLTAR